MDFLAPEIENYALAHTATEPELLQELNRETQHKVLNPRMLSGHQQGRFLSLLSKLIQPKAILEIGTYTGYSALCMAEGLVPSGQLHTIDKNEELETMARSYFSRSTFANQLHMHIGNALEVIPQLPLKWDLVFIDADKSNYSNYFDLIIDQVNPGGIILADNVLWSGKIIDPKAQDADTMALREFNQKMQADDRVENQLLPLRDGVSILRKK